MPTVLRVGPFRFFFYVGDGAEPPHVHVERDDCQATPEERGSWRLIGGGGGIHWPAIDEDISVANLLAGQPSVESQSSFKKWLASRTSAKRHPAHPRAQPGAAADRGRDSGSARPKGRARGPGG